MEYTTGLTDDEFDELLVRPREIGCRGASADLEPVRVAAGDSDLPAQ